MRFDVFLRIVPIMKTVMAMARRRQLKDAQRAKRFVRFSHRFEDLPIRGYVLDVGPKFFLMALVSDRIWFDGFECFRLGDVRDVMADPYAGFVESALRKRHERLLKKPSVSVADIQKLLLTAGHAFPLVAIQREQVDPSVCWIGRILGVERERVSLLEINPDGRWDDKPNAYQLNEITRVNFGGDYENALDLVGGDPTPANGAATERRHCVSVANRASLARRR
jgi:hypothetical protein